MNGGGHQSASGPGCLLDGGIPSAGVHRDGCWTPPSILVEGWSRQQLYYIHSVVKWFYVSSYKVNNNNIIYSIGIAPYTTILN